MVRFPILAGTGTGVDGGNLPRKGGARTTVMPAGSPGQIAVPIDDDVERLYWRLVSNNDQESLSVWRDAVV